MSAWEWLACPHCEEALGVDERVARCPRGHSFDRARQGYLNLLGRPQGANADTPTMLAHRHAFLTAGFYTPIAQTVVAHLAEVSGPRRVLEVGAGTGYYLSQVLEANPTAEGLGLDVSVAAARHLARAHPRMRAVVADAWTRMPLRKASVDVVLSSFAPRNAAEFARVLDAGTPGVVVTVTPRPHHLGRLREQLGLITIQPDKERHLAATLGAALTRGQTTDIDIDLDLDANHVADLVGMGPNAFHSRAADPAAVPVRTRAEVSITTWHR